MKHILLLLFSITLLGCTEKPPVPANPASPSQTVTVIGGQSFSDDNVSIWSNPISLTANTYYTLIDSVGNSPEKKTSSYIYALLSDGDSLQVKWFIDGKNSTNSQSKKWVSDIKKWLVTNSSEYSFRNESHSFAVKASLSFLKDNKTVTRETKVNVIKNIYVNDIFRLNFGMDKDEVKNNELDRIGSYINSPNKWQETSPSTSVIFYSSSLGSDSFTYYEFENNKLKRISESIELSVPSSFDKLINIAKYYKIPSTPSIIYNTKTSTYELNKEQTWNKGKMKFTLSNKDVQINASQKKKYFAITYEKL